MPSAFFLPDSHAALAVHGSRHGAEHAWRDAHIPREPAPDASREVRRIDGLDRNGHEEVGVQRGWTVGLLGSFHSPSSSTLDHESLSRQRT